MIHRQVVRAAFRVAHEELAHGAEVEQAVGNRLARQIVGEMRFTAELTEDDVFAWRGEVDDFGVDYRAVWAPDPSRGVELHGGPRDGQVVKLKRGEGPGGAFPPLRVVFPPVTRGEPWREPTLEPAELETVTYVRAGIAAVGRRFVYEVE